jgi:class 3 adenylate cyclase
VFENPDPADVARRTRLWFESNGPGDPLKQHYGVRSWEELNRQLADNNVGRSFTALVADVRQSTSTFTNSSSPKMFANTLRLFVAGSALMLRALGWWFDHFTGDGFMAYRLHTSESVRRDLGYRESLEATVRTTAMLHAFFHELSPGFIASAQDLLPGFGLALGLDAGPVFMTNVADTIVVMGHPVIGAARACGAAHSGETLFSGRLAANLYSNSEQLLPVGKMDFHKEPRETKEHPVSSGGQDFLVSTVTDEAWADEMWRRMGRDYLGAELDDQLDQLKSWVDERLTLHMNPIPTNDPWRAAD